MFRAAGLTFQSLQGQGLIFPVAECQVKYKAPTRYDDVLTVELWLSELSRIPLEFSARILKPDDTLVVEATTLHVAIGLDQKAKRMAPELMEKLKLFLP